MEFNTNIPIYSQVVEMILKQIITGELKPDDKLESVRNLSEQCKVNMNTIQKAYTELERLGIIYVQRGVGNFVVNDKSKINQLCIDVVRGRVSNFMQEMQSFNFSKEDIILLIKESE